MSLPYTHRASRCPCWPHMTAGAESSHARLAGVTCFKIEGRLKGPEYVALTTQVRSRNSCTCRRRPCWCCCLCSQLARRPGPSAVIAGRVSAPLQRDTTQVYRRAVDDAWAALGNISSSASGDSSSHSSAQSTASSSDSASSSGGHGSGGGGGLGPGERRSLAQVFARGQDEAFQGLTPGFLEGSQHQRLVRGRAPRHRCGASLV